MLSVFKWPWGKKKERPPVPRGFSIEEIIYTTTRNRMGVYFDWGLGYDAERRIAEEVYDKFMAKWGEQRLTNNIIDEIQIMMHDAEMREVEVMKLWKAEYGM